MIIHPAGGNFNPRSHEGSDNIECKVYHSDVLFQSTLPRGERRFKARRMYIGKEFQSTLPRGERRDLYPTILQVFQFQSTLPRGERHIPIQPLADIVNFNPRSHEGSDGKKGARHHHLVVFQSTLPRGERRYINDSIYDELIFQSTLPRGERQQFSPKSSLFSQQKLSKIFNLNNKLF